MNKKVALKQVGKINLAGGKTEFSIHFILILLRCLPKSKQIFFVMDKLNKQITEKITPKLWFCCIFAIFFLRKNNPPKNFPTRSSVTTSEFKTPKFFFNYLFKKFFFVSLYFMSH